MKKKGNKKLHPKWLKELDMKMEKIIREMERIHKKQKAACGVSNLS
ncbi:hypothetical protein HYV22_00880 [Candidatus Gottesmanbacteria bacterium]|nr:hypothetical protein [Candidatus Gottesmanbacteria bacterium]